MNKVDKATEGASGLIEAFMPALQFGTLGLAFVAIVAGLILLIFRRIGAGWAVALMLSAALLMILSTATRLPDAYQVREELNSLRAQVASIRGTGPVVDGIFRQGGELYKISFIGREFVGICPNSSITERNTALEGHIKGLEKRMDEMDKSIDRLDRMTKLFLQ